MPCAFIFVTVFCPISFLDHVIMRLEMDPHVRFDQLLKLSRLNRLIFYLGF
jgi:hypothetical protein